jgi:hypothetical protein
MDGISPVVFKAKLDDYYVALRHRNHLGVMSATAVPLTRDKNDPTYINFSDTTTATYVLPSSPGALPQKRMGIYHALWGGNANMDNKVVYMGISNDRDNIFFDVMLDPDNTAGSFNFIGKGYKTSDTDLNGKYIFAGTGNDGDNIFFNVLLHPLNVLLAPNYIIYQQIP